MTFTFDAALSTDRDRIRLEIGDTDSNGYFLQDETIAALLTREGTVGGAIVQCLYAILALLAQPNFKADWLQVDNDTAYKSMTALLSAKLRQYGVAAGTYTASVTHTYRKDSNQTEEPDYDWASGDEDDDLI